MRSLRRAAGLSLRQAHEQNKHQPGGYPAGVVLRSYEAGDRRCTLEQADRVLAPYGLQIGVLPLGTPVEHVCPGATPTGPATWTLPALALILAQAANQVATLADASEKATTHLP